MTRLEILAIRALPDEFVLDGTVIGSAEKYGTSRTIFVAINPLLVPIAWEESTGWQPIKISQTPIAIRVGPSDRAIFSEPQNPTKFDVLPDRQRSIQEPPPGV